MTQRRFGEVRAALVVAGLSDSDDGAADTDAAGTDAAGTDAAGTAAADTASDCVAAAQETVAAAQVPLQLNTTREPIDVTELAGKTVWFISPDQSIVFVADQAKGIQEAADAAGINLEIFDGKSNPELFNQGLATAVAQNADGVILNSVDSSLVTGPLADAKAAGIPIVDVFIGSNEGPFPDGIFASVTNDFIATGGIMADYAMATTGCETNAAQFTTRVYPALAALSDGIEGRFAERCPDCKIQTLEVDPSKLATDLGPLVSNTLQRDPDINHVITGFAGMVSFVIPSIEQLGRTTPIISQAAVDENWDLIRSGSLHAADASFAPAPYVGWLQFDQLLRGMVGADPADNEVPIQLIDSANVGADNEIETLFPGLAGYQDAFTENWGLG
jgi:ribose transport system substrate-binding protein